MILVLLLSVIVAHQASAAEKRSGGGLPLAALVGAQSPNLSAGEKQVLARLFNGDSASQTTQKIIVKADSVVCRASDIDLTLHSCDLAFGASGTSLQGAGAYYLFATLTLAGAAQEGAMGSIYESISNLECAIDPQALSGGAGADCTFETGQ